jgi:hypothetical protein
VGGCAWRLHLVDAVLDAAGLVIRFVTVKTRQTEPS